MNSVKLIVTVHWQYLCRSQLLSGDYSDFWSCGTFFWTLCCCVGLRYAIGGLAGGEEKDAFWRVVAQCTAGLPEDKPRYVMVRTNIMVLWSTELIINSTLLLLMILMWVVSTFPFESREMHLHPWRTHTWVFSDATLKVLENAFHVWIFSIYLVFMFFYPDCHSQLFMAPIFLSWCVFYCSWLCWMSGSRLSTRHRCLQCPWRWYVWLCLSYSHSSLWISTCTWGQSFR